MTTPERYRSKRHPDEQDLVRIVSASDELRRLLAAAAPPASAGAGSTELAGQARALSLFRAARAAGMQPQGTLTRPPEQLLHADQPPVPRIEFAPGPAARHLPVRRSKYAVRRSTRLAVVCRTRTIKLAIAGALSALVLTGMGVAVAAGGLPVPLQDAVHNLFDAPSPGSSSSTSTAPGSSASNSSVASLTPASTQAHSAESPSRAQTGTRRSASQPSSGAARSQPAGGVAASAAGLCRAFQAGDKSASALSAPGFAALVRAAGGTAQVPAYCTKLLGTAPSSGHNAKPSGPATSSTGPSGKSSGAVAKNSSAAKHWSAAKSSSAVKGTGQASKHPSQAVKPSASSARSSRPSTVVRLIRASQPARMPERYPPGDNPAGGDPPGDNGIYPVSGN